MTLDDFLAECETDIEAKAQFDYDDVTTLIALIRKLKEQRERWRNRSNEYNDYLPADVDDQELAEIINQKETK